MTTSTAHPGVLQIAANLGLEWRGSTPTAAIIAYCERAIAKLLKAAPDVATLDALEALVCRKVRLVIEEFESEPELDAIIRKYVGMGEYVFAAQKNDFDPATFATLIRRDNATPTCPNQFVAIIDCRGEKRARRYFTRWHEIAHILSLGDGQMAFPVAHRSTKNRDPVEQLMDAIAGEIGFYSPIFQPVVDRSFPTADALTFQAVEAVRESMCSRASFQATLNAVVHRIGVPAVVFEAAMGLKTSEERLARHPALFTSDGPVPKLRIRKPARNEAAKGLGLHVHERMRVPETSLVHRVFHEQRIGALRGAEDLDDWTTSDGESIGTGKVFVEARRHPGGVLAVMAVPRQ